MFRLLSDKVENTIQKYSMLSIGDKILIALSGGADSVCLTSVLNLLKVQHQLELHALYIDHGFRPHETKGEMHLCQNICDQYEIPFTVRTVDVHSLVKREKINKQEAARNLRYSAYEEAALELNADRIALGHTADDQAETFLLRMIRGSGKTGLGGIPPTRKSFIRPLIECGRSEIEMFLKSQDIDFATDSSNLTDLYTRNKVRIKLMPLLREFNPDIVRTLSKTAEILRDEERFFEILVTKQLMKMISRKTSCRIELFLSPLESMDRSIMRRLLRRAIDETKGLRGISFIHIEDIIQLIKNGMAGDRIYLPKGIRVIKEYAMLILTADPPLRLEQYTLSVPGKTILREAGVVITASDVLDRETQMETVGAQGLWKSFALIDADNLQMPLIVRRRQDGDFFFPAGFGRKKKLQDFFVDEKIPRDERDRVPLIISGNDIIWVVGYRGDHRYMVTESTQTVLRLETGRLKD